MWEQYKKTMLGMQVTIVLVTLLAYFKFYHHQFIATAVFFSVMQFGAIAGAFWAMQLRRRVQRFQTHV